jgi:hypothetical protein
MKAVGPKQGLARVMPTDECANPWLALPPRPPYVLSSDARAINAYNAKAPEDYRVQLNSLPEPFIGFTMAPVVFLNLNPGHSRRDPEDHAQPAFQALLRGNYGQGLSTFPFYSLDPAFENGGRKWWDQKLSPLLGIFKRDELARSILCIEYFPYHSRRFRHASLELPSQEYGFGLVRSAIARGAVIVIMRGRALWEKRIPGLEMSSGTFTLNSCQNVVVSPRNCAGFDVVVSAIRGEKVRA